MPEEGRLITTSAGQPALLLKPRILFVTPRALIRDCIGTLLTRLTPDFEITCCTGVSECETDQISLVIIWDDAPGAAATSFVQEQAGRCAQILAGAHFLAFVSRDSNAMLLGRLGQNVALLCIDTATPEIAEAGIRLAIAGETFISSRLVPAGDETEREDRRAPARGPIGITARGPSGKAASPGPRAIMTRRELELLERVDRGQQNKVIAYELGISESTVKVHLRNLMRKLNATNRTQVAFIARQMNVHH